MEKYTCTKIKLAVTKNVTAMTGTETLLKLTTKIDPF